MKLADWRRPKGFTLVEMLVAVGVLSLVTLVLGRSMAGLSRTADRVDAKASAADELRVAVHFLREALARTIPSRHGGPDRKPVFEGKGLEVTWTAVMPVRFGLAGRKAFRLGLETQADGSALMVLRIANMDLAPGGSGIDWQHAESRVLASDVRALSLEYGDGDAEDSWASEWVSRVGLPSRLRLQVALKGREWPQIVLPIRQALPRAEVFQIGGSDGE